MLNPACPGPTASLKRSLEIVLERAVLRHRLLLDDAGAMLTLTDECTDWLTQRFTHELHEARRNHEEVLVRLDALTATLRAATSLAEASGHDRWGSEWGNGRCCAAAATTCTQPRPPGARPMPPPHVLFHGAQQRRPPWLVLRPLPGPLPGWSRPAVRGRGAQPIVCSGCGGPSGPCCRNFNIGTDAPVAAAADPVVPAEGPLGHEMVDPVDFNRYNEN